MTVTIITPWRVTQEHYRLNAFHLIARRIAEEFPDIERVTGWCNRDRWCKAIAVNDGLLQTDADTLVVWDADVWCDPDAVRLAIENCDGWSIPHRTVHRLTRFSTDRVLQGGRLEGPCERAPYRGMPAGGLFVIRRDLYERAPFDRRFKGWGHEDESAGIAWRTLYGQPWRGRAKLWHLWHPPQSKLSPAVGSKQSYELMHRYRAAADDVSKIESLLEEVR